MSKESGQNGFSTVGYPLLNIPDYEPKIHPTSKKNQPCPKEYFKLPGTYLLIQMPYKITSQLGKFAFLKPFQTV